MLLAKLLLLLPLLAPPQPLAEYLNNKRILLIFAPSATDDRVKQQNALLDPYAKDLRERDLAVVRDFKHPTDLRTKYHVAAEEFTVILIGKDGGEKLRQHTPITVRELSSTIDAMPMRQDEMRGKE